MSSPFALVQDTGRGSGVNSFTRQFAGIPAAGDALFFPCAWTTSSGGNDLDISDDSGLITWQTAVLSPNEFGTRTKIFYTFNLPTLSASPIITVTRQGAQTTTIQGACMEWSGFGANDPLSATASKSGANTTNFNTNTSGAVAEIDVLLVAVVVRFLFTTTITVETVDPAWTQYWEATAGVRAEADYRVLETGSGGQICHWTVGSNDDYSACIAAFCLNNTPSIERANQVVQSVVSQASPVLRGNQIVQSLTTQNVPILRVNQVVQILATRSSGAVPGVILKLDTDSQKDRNTPFMAFIKTRAIPPAGSVHRLGHVREPLLTTVAGAGVSLQIEVNRDHGKEVQDSTVTLTADGTETLVIKKCEGAQEADCAIVQFKIGDAAPVENTWDLHHFLVPSSQDGDK